MKKTVIIAGIITSISLIVTGINAQEGGGQPNGTPEEAQIKKLADLGPGVHKIEKDASNKLQKCVIVGQSRMSTVLGTAKGLETARKRATLNARAEFVRWMKTSVKAVESREDEAVVYLQGDDAGLKESGKATEVTKDNAETLATGLIRGMIIIGFNQDSKTEMLTAVYGWSPKLAVMAKDVETINANPESGQDSGKRVEPARGPIPEKTVVSDDAKEFLKNAK